MTGGLFCTDSVDKLLSTRFTRLIKGIKNPTGIEAVFFTQTPTETQIRSMTSAEGKRTTTKTILREHKILERYRTQAAFFKRIIFTRLMLRSGNEVTMHQKTQTVRNH